MEFWFFSFLRKCCWAWCMPSFVLGALLIAAQADGGEAVPIQSATDSTASSQNAAEFEADGVTFRSDFDGAAVSEYKRVDAGDFELTIRPENRPINNSAWYAFRVVADRARSIVIRLSYEHGTHRYHPKVSRDGRNWSRLDDALVERSKDKRQAVLRLDIDTEPTWVAAQELIGRETLESWMEELAEHPFADRSIIGRSVEDNPIYRVRISESDAPRHVIVIGRQHPPEVTGTLGLMAFVNRLVESDRTAVQFRKAYQLHVVGLVNPDGVDRGYWRHNVRGVDLNRDWGKFAQPETRAVRDDVLPLQQPPDHQVYLWLDFHSTHQDVFYTQPDEAETFPPQFTRRWLEAFDQRTPGYSVRRVSSLGTRPTSQQWAHRSFGAPAITYEFGDNTDRVQIRQVTRIAAEQMMRLLIPLGQPAD